MVFRDVLEADEVDHALSLIWDALEGLNRGIDRHDPHSWASRRRRDPEPANGRGWIEGDGGLGLISAGMEEFGFTHSEACWYVRGVPALRDAFAAVLGTDDLEVSFDGLSLFRPWSFDPKWATESGWFHHDRGPVGFEGASVDAPTFVQGVLNLLPTSRGSGGNVCLSDSSLGLSIASSGPFDRRTCSGSGGACCVQVVLPRSHLLYPQLVEELGTLRTRDDGSQRLSLPEEYEQMLAEQRPEMFEGAIVAHLEPGDLFLWCVWMVTAEG